MPRAPLLVIAVVVAGCGKLADEGDAGPGDAATDAGVRCQDEPFGAPTALATLATSADERGIRFSADERTALFSRGHHDATGVGADNDIFMTTRDGLEGPWSTPVDLLTVDNAYLGKVGFGVVYPTLLSDGVSLFFEGYCESSYDPPWASRLCKASPDAGTQPVQIAAGNMAGYPGPFGIGSHYGDGIAVHDTEYYFASLADDGGTGDGIFAFDVSPPANMEAQLVLSPPSSIFVDNPVVTDDELVMFLSLASGPGATQHVAVATRASKDAPFGTPTPLHELDSAEGEYPTWVSPDRCRLYLTRIVGGQTDLYVASRKP